MEDNGLRSVVGGTDDGEVILRTICVPLKFLVLEDVPFQVIIGISTLEALGAWLDTDTQLVTLRMPSGTIKTTIPLMREGAAGDEDDGGEFTSTDE